MKTLIITRAKWDRGNIMGGRLLDRSSDKMCCLGFLSLACGAKRPEILNKGTPDQFLNELADTRAEKLRPRFAGVVRKKDGAFVDTKICGRLMEINDKLGMDEPKREARLIAWFRKIGWNVRFVDSAKTPSVAKHNEKV